MSFLNICLSVDPAQSANIAQLTNELRRINRRSDIRGDSVIPPGGSDPAGRRQPQFEVLPDRTQATTPDELKAALGAEQYVLETNGDWALHCVVAVESR